MGIEARIQRVCVLHNCLGRLPAAHRWAPTPSLPDRARIIPRLQGSLFASIADSSELKLGNIPSRLRNYSQ